MKKIISNLTKISLTLLIIISQLVLPLNIKAEEIDTKEIDTNYKVTINEEELIEDTFNIDSSSLKNIKIIQEYTGIDNYLFSPSKIMEIDYTNRLYGNYKYPLSVSNNEELLNTKDIVINYLGNNNEIINSNNIYYNNKTYFILGDINKQLTKLDIKSKFNNNLSNYNALLNILDKEDNELLNDTDIVENDYKLQLKATYTDYEIKNEIEDIYNLNIVEDINKDEVIDNKDIQERLVEKILNEEEYNVIDATNVVLDNIEETSQDNLTTTFEYNNNIFLDEELTINYYINGFNEDVLKGIEGNLKYDKDILELTSIEINSTIGNINDNGHFIYLLNNFNENGLLMTLKFKPLSVGTTTINIDNIKHSTGAKDIANVDNNDFEAEITILENGKGSDVEEEVTPDNSIDNEVLEESIQNKVTPLSNEKKQSIKPILLSGDNFIKSLKIKNHDLNFNKETLTYQLDVKNNINSLEFEVILNDNNASYKIVGNENFKSGKNIVEIIVTAENGNEKTYTIEVNKEVKEIIKEETIETEKTQSKAIVIFLIILVIIGLVYVIFTDDETEEKQ